MCEETRAACTMHIIIGRIIGTGWHSGAACWNADVQARTYATQLVDLSLSLCMGDWAAARVAGSAPSLGDSRCGEAADTSHRYSKHLGT